MRWAIATSRTHSRHIARLMRAATAGTEDVATADGESEEPARGAAASGEPIAAGPCAGLESPCPAERPSTDWMASAPVQALLIFFAMRGFAQGWNVEVEVPEDEAKRGGKSPSSPSSAEPAAA